MSLCCIKISRKRKQNQSETKSVQMEMQLTDNSPVYIRIPVLKMFGSESDSSEPKPKDVTSTYKLIDGVPSSKDIRVKKYYVMSYDGETKNAEWVYEILNRDTLVQNDITGISFTKCIQNPGYHQGHLAAAANHRWCQEAYNSTFLFSNISPQAKALNTGIWKMLEDHCRKIIDNDKENKVRNVHVYTGPILPKNGLDSEDEWEKKSKAKQSNDDDSKKKKAVPEYFFKVIIVENYNGTVEQPKCYLIPNDESELRDDKQVNVDSNLANKKYLEKHKMSIENIQEKSGLTFIEKNSSIKTDRIRKVKWTGEKGNGESCSAEIEVRITTPHT